MNKLLSAALGVTVFASLAACAAPASDEAAASDDALRSSIQPGAFKLYREPGHTPSLGCDVFTALELSANPARATLREELGAGDPRQPQCRLFVPPNERSYELRFVATSCGSKIYKGARRAAIAANVDGAATITVTDHRTRVCRDMVPAKVIVEETVPSAGFPDVITTTLYSFDGRPFQPRAFAEGGTLVRQFAIGGETTGFGLQLTSGAVEELVLDRHEARLFADGKKAFVKGSTTELFGVEIPTRTAIKVDELLVCPPIGTAVFNCMPPTSGSLVCGEARPWVEANCPGVTYLD